MMVKSFKDKNLSTNNAISEGEIKIFLKKQKLREFMTRPYLTRNVQESSSDRNKMILINM